jgi:hypothetical protein
VPSADELLTEARTFASQRSDLLNKTVCDGPRVSAVLDRTAGECWVAYKIRPGDHIPHEMIPLCLGGKPRVFLRLLHVLRWDDERRYLADERSYLGLYSREEMTDDACLIRYDFNRDLQYNTEQHPYPIAHVHVYGDNHALDELQHHTDVTPKLSELHIPLGGRRFRPTLEDVIEFAIVEGMVTARPNWREVIDRFRADWEAMQLQAAVRRNPEAAATQLQAEGWRVVPP